jgi:DNA repair exonuclease SbcCD nuclease subunit
MRFIHASDLHLGYRQYDLEERSMDFARSFKKIAEHAVSVKADFVLLAGDLFHSRNINASTFMQAHHILSILRDANIACVAIEGNHDRPMSRDGMSWLESLQQQDLIRLIKPGNERLMDGFVEIGDARIYGMCYAGSMTSETIPRIIDDIREIEEKSPAQYKILMMHLGIEGKMNGRIVGEVTYEDISPLKGIIDYLALGHYHNAFDIDGWVYNPGCPDTCSISESSLKKGFYDVHDGKVELLSAGPRKFIIISIDVNKFMDAGSVFKELEKRIDRQQEYEKPPVVHVIFYGSMNFERAHISVDKVKELVLNYIKPLYIDVRFDLSNDEFCVSDISHDRLDRTAIEHDVFKKLSMRDSIISPYADRFAFSLAELKDLAIKESDGTGMDDILRKFFDDIRNGNGPKKEMPEGNTNSNDRKPAESSQENGDKVWDWRKKR